MRKLRISRMRGQTNEESNLHDGVSRSDYAASLGGAGYSPLSQDALHVVGVATVTRGEAGDVQVAGRILPNFTLKPNMVA